MIVVGGVGHLYLGDLDVGRHVVERLAQADPGPDVVVEDLWFGALAVAQRLDEMHPDALVLVGAVERGRRPGSVERRVVADLALSPEEVQGALHDAGTGYVAVELVVEVAWALGALPPRTVVIEVEPQRTEPSEALTPAGARGRDAALAAVHRELDDLRRAVAGR